MTKTNCWEIKKCGRQSGGPKEKELGVCPAATNFTHNGKNGGREAGRYCWKIAGTLCGGRIQDSFAEKMMNCTRCDVFIAVKAEERMAFVA